ncbi:hypothetical protein [Sphingomonas sp. CARO-RG-8B-R24-01]|uniref:hypothetical protein n=1 Tax=Sphingomonas sp. CARO-RG-8B-R24-01 TaxID=2914831 RepID=UPI001F587EFE|nr:hypothetical protein [Sphingomonas sp. CARO-RG-8B-R24-01]
MKVRLCAIVLIALPTIASAAIAPQAMIVGDAATPTLRIGTQIPVQLRTELTTQNKVLRVGQRFEVETTEPVMLNGQIVIPVGTPGTGEITRVTNKGMWGKSGHFEIRLLYLRVGDREIRLSGTLDDKGKAGGLGAAAVSAIVFLPAGFFMTGTSARMPAGTIIKGSLGEDVPVAFANIAPARPLQVAGSAAGASGAPGTTAAPVSSPAIATTTLSSVAVPK